MTRSQPETPRFEVGRRPRKRKVVCYLPPPNFGFSFRGYCIVVVVVVVVVGVYGGRAGHGVDGRVLDSFAVTDVA